MNAQSLWAGRILVVFLLVSVGMALGPGGPHAGWAQEQDTIPRNPDAEQLFEEGISAYEQGDYETASDRLRLVLDFPLHQKTTAALLMRAKALVQIGDYPEAEELLSTLLDRYPNTSYREEAQQLRQVVREQGAESDARPDTLHVGIVLPMDSENVTLSQALFNGIRLAVDEHNGVRRRYVPPDELASADTFDVYDTASAVGDSLAAAEGSTTVATDTDTVRVDSLSIVTERVDRPDWVAKMHFRPTGDSTEAVRAAVDSLAQFDEADVILGPLYSRNARAAGAAAEEAQTLLVPPLANAESVSVGRDYVFQTNPTRPLRGRLMARFAAESLLLDRVGIVYEDDNRIGEQMATSFRDEAEQHDLEVPFTLRLKNARDWSRLPDVVEDDSTITDSLMAETESFYLPIAGRNAAGKIQDALTGLGRLDVNARVLGNAEWHDLPIKKQASQFDATYTNDFYVQSGRPEVQRFVRRYRLLTGNTPDNLSVRGQRLAYTGYDVAHFLLNTLTPGEERPQPRALRTASPYEGLGIRIDFEETNVNRALFFHRYRANRLELMQ
ncbi:MAG: ABC transporter substrate-binding protein [Salinivenus sp.]